MKPQIKIFESPENLAENLALEFQSSVKQTAKFNRNFFMILSGGSTPSLFFKRLASVSYRENIPWQNVHFFWGDERCVPPDHPDSNYGMTKEYLFDHISIPNENIHRIFGENDPEVEAQRYAKEIIQFVPQNFRNLPQFDWILLGLGTDGHTASIFPGSHLLTEKKSICSVAIHPETGQHRITLNLPLINNAKRVSFLVTGKNKAAIVSRVLGTKKTEELLPASYVKPGSGNLEWFLDGAAGKLI